MKIFEEFEIIGNYSALYNKEMNAVIISDLHLGLESLMARAGMLMPKFQLREIKQEIEEIIERKEPEKLVICGDIKHEFSKTSKGEKQEIQEFIEYLSDQVKKILLVKGNHDNYLIYATKKYENVELKEQFTLKNTTFIHGHQKQMNLETQKAEYIIIGHEHPALSLTDKIGIKEKVSCFLYGETTEQEKKIIVMPAFSKLAEGSQVNLIKEKDLLSPILRNKTNLNNLKAIAVDREAGKYKFPEIGEIQD